MVNSHQYALDLFSGGNVYPRTLLDSSRVCRKRYEEGVKEPYLETIRDARKRHDIEAGRCGEFAENLLCLDGETVQRITNGAYTKLYADDHCPRCEKRVRYHKRFA